MFGIKRVSEVGKLFSPRGVVLEFVWLQVPFVKDKICKISNSNVVYVFHGYFYAGHGYV